jgi:uncharacterized protein involved in exopolysaccharide biosynthesis
MDSGPLTFAALLAGMLLRWRTVLVVAVATIFVALALSFVLPPTYRALTSFVTTDAGVQLPQGLSALAAEPGMSGLASQLGIGSSRDPSVSPDFYAQLLDSRELLTRIVTSRFADPRASGDSATLVQIYRIRSRDPERAVESAIKKLHQAMWVTFDAKTDFVVLRVDARWPGLSAEIANRAVRLVGAFNKEQRYSRARAKREFLEGRVADAQAELRVAEDSLESLYERNRLWQSSPSLIVEARRRQRQVDEANALYVGLRQQYEEARIDEVNNTPVITVVDPAVPPKLRQWPHRGLIAITAAILGLGLGLIWGAVRELASHWARNNPEQADLLRTASRRAFREIGTALPGGKRRGQSGKLPA